MAREQITWQTIDTGTFPPQVLGKWQAYEKANEAMKAARSVFEKAFVTEATRTGDITDDMNAVFSYRWDQVAIGFASQKTGGGKAKFGLSSAKPKGQNANARA